MTPRQQRQEIIRDTVRRFQHLPTRTIARHIIHNYGPIFDNNFENVRASVRYILEEKTNGKEKSKNPIPRTGKVSIPKTWREERTAYKLPEGKWLVLSDIHIPFHEPRALEEAIKYGQDKKVTGLLLNGDAQDCAAVSFWPSSIKRDFDKEIELFIDFLDFIDKELNDCIKVYKPGNHEYRLPRYYQQKAPELTGIPLQSVINVLGLDYRGIEYLDYKQIVMAGKLPILHGHELPAISRAVNPARGLFLRTKSWAACAHCHTTSEHTAKNIQGTLLTTWSFGCLCDLTPDYNTIGNDWNHGFAIINVEKDGNFEVLNKRILSNWKVA